MFLPDLIASVIVKAHRLTTIKPEKQIKTIAISLMLTSIIWSGDHTGLLGINRILSPWPNHFTGTGQARGSK